MGLVFGLAGGDLEQSDRTAAAAGSLRAQRPPTGSQTRHGTKSWHTGLMIGAIIITFIILVAIPVGFLMSTTAAAALIGEMLKSNAETIHADSELLECNK